MKRPVILGLLLLGLFLPGCAPTPAVLFPAPMPEGSLAIQVVSDLHYLAESLRDDGGSFLRYATGGDGKNLLEISLLLETLTQRVEREVPQVLVISGDLTNNGEKASHEELTQYLHRMEKAGTQVLVIPGNHDLLNPHARGFQGEKQYLPETVTPEEFAKIYGAFGYDEAASRDEASLSYVTKVSEGLWFLMLDDNRYDRNLSLGYPETGGVLSLATIRWMTKVLEEAQAKGVQVITVSHHNGLSHSPGAKEGYVLDNDEEFLNRIRQYGVRLNLTGHVHVQDIQKNLEKGTFYEIATGAFSVYPHLSGYLEVKENGEMAYAAKPLDLTGVKIRKGWRRVSLAESSKAHFQRASVSRILARLTESGSFSKAELQSMEEVLGALNLAYFSGGTHAIPADLLSSAGYQLILEKGDEKTKGYAQRILSTDGEDDVRLTLPPFSKP